MGANTLTDLFPTIYAALDVVSRERVGFIPAVMRNSGLERAALNQPILVPIVPAATSQDNTPAMQPPDNGDQVIGNTPISITKSKNVPVRWNGEQTKGMQTAGTYEQVLQQQFEQAFRTLCNEIETDIALLYKRASRAYGTAGTTPFGTVNNLSDVAGVLKILDDNGCPPSGLHMVVGTTAMANIRGIQAQLFKVNEAGTADLLRRGTIAELEGFAWHMSGQVVTHTKGTGTGYLVNDGTPPVIGDTAITTDTGTGTVVAGDVVTLAGDTNKYIVGTALGSNVLTLNKPGLRMNADDDDAITVGNNFTANLAFHQSAIQLVTRLPALPEGGDAATDTMTVTDPMSGLSFEIAKYSGFLQNAMHVRIAWGVSAIKPEHMAVLLG